jgi:hypothetical protein
LITGLGRVASVLLQRVQELGHDFGVKIVKPQLSYLLLAGCTGELQEQAHRIRVARYRVRPQPLLKFEVVVEERRQDRTE